MADETSDLLAIARDMGQVIGKLAGDEETFAEAYDTFRAVDWEGFQASLDRGSLAERCHLVCEWFSTKYCVRVCRLLCAEFPIPEGDFGPEDIRQFARLTAQITADPALLRRLAASVEGEDAELFKRLIVELKAERYCFFLCRWVCGVRVDLVCGLLCTPIDVGRPGREPNLFEELRISGEIIGKLAEDQERFGKLVEAFRQHDCDGAQEIITEYGIGRECERLCLWFCSWECVLVCFLLCGPFGDEQITVEEVREFADVCGRLAADDSLLGPLVDAVQKNDPKTFGVLIKRLEIERFCHQLCAWLCGLICREFCICLCPPLICDLTGPTGCTDEELNEQIGGMTVEVVGSAGGGGFDHYTLEWRKVEGQACDDDSDWSSAGVVYPGGGTTGTSPVFGGTLGWIDTTTFSPASFEIRLCVYSHLENVDRHCCCIQFDLFKKLVWIARVGGYPVQTPPGPFSSTAPIVDPPGPSGTVVPVGCCVTVKGSAFVGDCNDRKIRCFDLRYAPGFLPGPNDGGFNPAAFTASMLPTPVCYDGPDESLKRAPWNWVIGERALTTQFVKTSIQIFNTTIDVYKLQDFCFNSASLLPLGVTDGGCPDPHHRCRSGKYTLLLQVEDTDGNLYYDTQQVWFDNKPMQSDVHVKFSGIEGLPSCSDLHLGSPFVPPGAPCAVPWPVNLLGIAYDEYIDETDTSYPSDNFDIYSLSITRQGGPSIAVPITPDLVSFGANPYVGTQRVGDPGTRCEPLPPAGGCPPPPPPPSQMIGLLSMLDLRVFDATCAPSIPASEHYSIPAGFSLERGECCGYTFQLYARDKTRSDGGGPGQCHAAWSLPWAVCICNDLEEEKK